MNEGSEAAAAESVQAEQSMRVCQLPLNSRRITTSYLQQIARAMELPTAAPADDLRQMIDGKLSGEMERSSQNVQVIITPEPVSGGAHLSLQDHEGVFLEIEPESSRAPGAQEPTEERDRLTEEEGEEQPFEQLTTRVTELRRELEEAAAQNSSLVAEVSSLREEVERGKGRIREIWTMSCEQAVAYEEELSSKESEIAALRARLEARSSQHRPGASPQPITTSRDPAY